MTETSVPNGEKAWLVDAKYEEGHVGLTLIRTSDLRPIKWLSPRFRPYYLEAADEKEPNEKITKFDLFLENERTLRKVEYSTPTPPKKAKGWETEVAPTLSYTYDNGLHFGLIHEFRENHWTPQATPAEDDLTRFTKLLSEIGDMDPLKQSILAESYTVCMQAVPSISPKAIGLSEAEWSQEQYHRAILLSRLTNLPLRITYGKNAVAEWIRGMLHNYYRKHNILIPNREELRLGSDKMYVTGALTITPASGAYFNMVVLDFESLYPGVTDIYNLSYETVQCRHQDCRDNLVPGLEIQIHVCRRRRGIYSAMLGALRELRIYHFKPLSRTLSKNSSEWRIAQGASQALKLLLNASYGVTVRIQGLASPLLGEAITAYGRYVLQSTFDMAKEKSLNPKYGDTDSIFLDDPDEARVKEFIEVVKQKTRLELAYDRKYDVCVLSNAMKAYFGILPDGETDIKGLTVAKSNSPRFFLTTFQDCLKVLATGRHSPQEFEQAKSNVPAVVKKALHNLAEGRIPLEDLEYRVELRDDPASKASARAIPQAYQAAILLLEHGEKVRRGMEVGFVKVRPFKHKDRNFSVKPLSQAKPSELNMEDYVRNLTSSLQQTFEPMGIKLEIEQQPRQVDTGLSRFC